MAKTPFLDRLKQEQPVLADDRPTVSMTFKMPPSPYQLSKRRGRPPKQPLHEVILCYIILWGYLESPPGDICAEFTHQFCTNRISTLARCVVRLAKAVYWAGVSYMDDQFDNSKPPEAESDQTIIVSKSAPWLRKLRKSTSAPGALVTHCEITLVVRNMAEHVRLEEDRPVIIGRADLGAGLRPDIDLSNYGAQEYGVSREHARLHLKDQRLYLIDLGSSNGTFVAGQQLTPHKPHILREGDEILFGRLAARIEIG
jgi:hypothetical protein